jgi:hypothetical protein
MVKKIQYVNKTTREVAPTLEQWIESIADPVDKASVLEIYNAEVENETTPGNPPLESYLTMFQRYFTENNIEIIQLN